MAAATRKLPFGPRLSPFTPKLPAIAAEGRFEKEYFSDSAFIVATP